MEMHSILEETVFIWYCIARRFESEIQCNYILIMMFVHFLCKFPQCGYKEADTFNEALKDHVSEVCQQLRWIVI